MPAGFLTRFHSSHLILFTVAALAVTAVVLFYMGLLGWVFHWLGSLVRGTVFRGFLIWRRLFAWATWPVFLAAELALLVAGDSLSEVVPWFTVVCGLIPWFMGVSACLAYMFIDLERYEVERGYKAVHNPLKGQELAENLVTFGPQVGVSLLAAAAIGAIGGFALLNLGLYRSIGEDWYHFAEGKPAYSDFLAYSLVSLYRIVDVLDLANSRHWTHVAIIKTAAWPASTLLTLFRTFFTLVLLQQIFASVRKGKLLAEMIADFWSPHEPIHHRARAALPQYGTIAVGPLLTSLRSVETLTKEQRDQLPLMLAMIGPSTIPILVRYLHDSHEHVRAVVVAALGQMHAVEALASLVPLAKDPSGVVRLSVIEALGLMAAPKGQQQLRKRRRFRLRGYRFSWLWWRKPAAPAVSEDPVALAVTALGTALNDESAGVRTHAAMALGRIGPAAEATAGRLIARLKDNDESVRCEAAEALAQVGGTVDLTVQSLASLLADASSAVRASAARALGALREAARPTVPTLVSLLQDRQEAVRTAAAEAIAQAGPLDEQATKALAGSLGSTDTVAQAQAAEALGAIGTAAQDAAPALVEVLENGRDLVRVKAAEALGKIGEAVAETAVPSLVRALRDQESWVSAVAAQALGEMGESAEEALPALVRSLKHGNALVRGNAAEALGKMAEAAADARSALEAATQDEDDEVRSQAVRALGAIGRPTPTTQDAVLLRLRDHAPAVRAAAVEALGQWGEAGAVAPAALVALLEDSNDRVKVAVTNVLPRLAGADDAAVAGLCRRLLEDDNVWVQINAALALGRLGPHAWAAGGPLLHVARTGEESLREQAIRAIAKIQPPEAIQAFAAGLKDASADIRKIASAGCIKTETIPEAAIPAMVEALRDPEPQVQANVARALSRLDVLPEDSIPALIACTADGGEVLRLNAAVALRRAPTNTVAETMRRLIDDPNPRIRLVAAGAVLTQSRTDAKASNVLAEALEDPAPSVRKAALDLLHSLEKGAELVPV
jgi:HEAT repeat protein